MKIKTIFSVIFIFCILLGLVWLFAFFREKNHNGLIIIGKAPSFSFVNQNGQNITNQAFKGKIYVVDFFFTSCPSICPIMSSNMVMVQNAFPKNNIGIASFSIDPEQDSPEILKEYAKRYGVTNPNWHFLTGSETDVYKLANDGFNIYAKQGNTPESFEHSGLFALIDQNGYIVSRTDANGNPIIYYNGLDKQQVDFLIEDIKKLM
ncbi:MAG: SCO family protein [Capnocytophaga sp.]|nr:SCO family protein [Capnocytophaga sp.]